MKVNRNNIMVEPMSEIDECCFNDVSQTRRPTLFWRGKTITKEQLVQLMLNEEPILRGWDKDGNDIMYTLDDELYIDRDYYGMLGCCLQRRGFGWETSMVLQDGTIYGSKLEFKYPRWDEYVANWVKFAERNPFLDMIVSYTDIDESGCHSCTLVDYFCNQEASEPKYTYCNWNSDNSCILRIYKEISKKVYDLSKESWVCRGKQNKYSFTADIKGYEREFLQNLNSILTPFDYQRSVKVTLYIHDGQCDILTGKEAISKFLEYDRLYGDFRLSMLNHSYLFGTENKNLGNKCLVHFSNKFMRELCSHISSRELWDDVIVSNYINKYPEDAIVVTKEWLCNEYDKAFNGTVLDINNINKIWEEYRFKGEPAYTFSNKPYNNGKIILE